MWKDLLESSSFYTSTYYYSVKLKELKTKLKETKIERNLMIYSYIICVVLCSDNSKMSESNFKARKPGKMFPKSSQKGLVVFENHTD